MVTKYPTGGNRVIGSPAPRRRRRRGVALISVISVLVLLMIVATPFLMTMRDSARRGERFLYSTRAEAEAEALFDRVRTVLVRGVEHVERKTLDSAGAAGAASSANAVADDATPTSDTPAEFAIPADMLREFNQTDGREHRVWGVEIRDTQSMFNLNSCSVGILSNLLGRAELNDTLMSGDDRIPVTSVAGFPAKDGVIRIGSEVIKYREADRATNSFVGCERGYMTDRPENGPAAEHQKGDLVMHEAAWQIATRPFRAKAGAWQRYTNVYEARAISEMGVAALAPEDFDRIRRFLTAWNGNVVGDGWSNPQQVRNALTAADRTERYAQIRNLRYFGPGTIVRITDGVNDDYAVVTKVRGTNNVLLAGNISHDYAADQTRIYSLARAPINVNTASVDTLTVCFEGLGLVGRSNPLTRDQAKSLAQFLKTRVPPAPSASAGQPQPAQTTPPAPGVYRTWDDFVAALEEARDTRGLIDADGFEAVLRNAMNACDSNLSFSTVPFTFRSFDVYEARATAALMGLQGQEIARRELTRVFEVASPRSATFVLETQADFQDQIRITRDAKWFVSYPVNVNAYYDGVNEPASEYDAYANRNRFPDTDRAQTAGHLQLREAAFRLTGRNDRYIHFDEQESPEGFDLSKGDLTILVDTEYSAKDRKADLRRYVQLPQQNEQTEVGLAPFACSFWYKPGWGTDNAEHTIFDYGFEEEFMNRVSLRFDPARNALVLGVCDATREQKACEIVYVFDASGPVKWEKDQWVHIACTVYGCSPSMMELFVDAEQVGRPALMTRLTNTIPATGDVQSLDGEDFSGFPDAGVVILRAPEGMELIEYTQRTDTRLQVSRRKARSLDRVLDTTTETPRTHSPGETIELYGFAAPLYTDIKRGGATLASSLGPWRAYRAFGNATAQFVNTATPPSSLTLPRGIPGDDDTTITLTEWESGAANATTLAELGGANAEGIAVLITRNRTLGNGTLTVTPSGGSPETTYETDLGGVDLVHYRVTGISSSNTSVDVVLVTRGLALRHYDANTWMHPSSGNKRFFPSYDYGATGSPYTDLDPQTGQALTTVGAHVAFIPIGLVVNGGSADYLDPADQEPQLGNRASAYVQLDSEWVKYDTYDSTILAPKVAFYRDLVVSAALTNGRGLEGLFNASGGANVQSIVSQSTGRGGGSGGVSSNTEPQTAQDGNDEATAPAAAPTDANTNPYNTSLAILEPYVGFSYSYFVQNAGGTTQDGLAVRTDHRSWEERSSNRIWRIANTIARTHASGTTVIPCFALYNGNDWDTSVMGRRAYPGFNDLLTLRDTRGADEQIRVQWGWRNWVGPTQSTVQTWQWDRPQNDIADLRRYPSQCWTRALKFPSSEMPDSLLTTSRDSISFGKHSYDSQGGTTPGFVDELAFQELEFPADDRRDYVFLGIVPAQLYTTQTSGTNTQPLRFNGIDEKQDEIPVFMPWYDPNLRAVNVQGLPIPDEVFRPDGGVIRIDDELIMYSSWDAGAGTISGCLRGVFNTVARPHQYGAIVFPVESFAASTLTSSGDASTASFELQNAADFPDDGYLRIADGLEVVGYTQYEANRLSGPLARIDEGTTTTQNQGSAQRRVGGALFRGRFATEPAGHAQGDVAIALPWRHYDRYSERSDDPENSYTQFSWTKENAIWKRVTWDEQPVKNVEVIALVRFSGGPAWDSDRVIRVGQQDVPKEDRRGWLYEITDPAAMNLLNVESDRIEVRLMVRFAKGSYDRAAVPRPNEWKLTPHIRRVLVEYVAPGAVLSQE